MSALVGPTTVVGNTGSGPWYSIPFSGVSGTTPITLLAAPPAPPAGSPNLLKWIRLASWVISNSGTAGKVYLQDSGSNLLTSFDVAAGTPIVFPFNADRAHSFDLAAALACAPGLGLQIYTDASVTISGHVIAGYQNYQRWPALTPGAPVGSPLGLAGLLFTKA